MSSFEESGGLTGYRDFLVEGEGYLRVVQGSVRRPQVFTPEIVFNTLSMAIEKFMMAVITYSGCLPENHTFWELSAAYHAVCALSQDDRELLLALDERNNLCSLEAFRQTIPEPEELASFQMLAERLQGEARRLLGTA